jgi:hypothetical protein
MPWFFLFQATVVVEKKRNSRVMLSLADLQGGNLEQEFFFERNTW